MQQQSSSQKNDNGREYAKWAGLGFEFVGVLAVFCYMGYKLDKALNTSPWLLLAAFAVGFIGMLYIILKQSWRIWRK
ncbi:MAG: AtpZ/AtpI family protein [Sedimentisphaerales bacterium]